MALTNTKWTFNNSLTKPSNDIDYIMTGTLSNGTYTVTFANLNCDLRVSSSVGANIPATRGPLKTSDKSTVYPYIAIFPDGTGKYYSSDSNSVSIVGPFVLDITGEQVSATFETWLQANATPYVENYTVTATLTNLTATPTIPSTVAPDGSLSFTLSANTGYGLPTDITVTGGTKSYDNTTGVVSITDLTGDVTINAVGVAIYTVTGVLTNITATGLPETVRADGTINATLTANTGYTLPLIVYVEGGSVVYGTDGTVTINNITGNVTLTATGVPIEYTITKTLDGVTANIPSKIKTGQTKTFTVATKLGYILPDDITVQNATYTYNKTTGQVTISQPTANVIIKIYGKVALTDMARKGGYQLVNFKGISLTAGTGATISGVFSAIQNANGKRIIISGLVIGGTQYNDVPVEVTVNSSNYIFNCYGYDFVITSADLVTATVES